MTPCLTSDRRSESEARADHEAIGEMANQLFTEYRKRMGWIEADFDKLSPDQREFWRDRAADRLFAGGMK